MIDKPHRFLDRPGAVAVRRPLPLDQNDGKAEAARGGDLAVGGLAAGILADDHVDATLAQKRLLRLDGEGAAGEQVVDMGSGKRRIDGINAAHEIMVLRRGIESLRLLPADGEEHAARHIAQRRHGPGHRGNPRPAVALDLLPAEPFEPEERNARRRARRAGIGGNPPCKGMGRIDQQVDGLGQEMGLEPRRAAEAAGAHRDGLRRGVERAAGERQRDGKIGPAGKPAREAARLGRAAQYEDAFLVHA